jgi:hypothetical protein
VTGNRPWHGADAERRAERASSPAARSGAERSGAEGALSLDYRTYVAPAQSSGEWHVQQTVVDDYCEFVAVEDPEHSLRRRSKREAEEGTLEEVVDQAARDERLLLRNAAAVRRAKRACKWKVLMLRGDRLWTLTTRGGIRTREEAWKLWGQFERYCSRRFRSFKVVVVMEQHKSGTFHIHFVSNRFFDVNSMRLWWHRILTSTSVDSDGVIRRNPHRLEAVLKGEASPGNVDVSKVLRSRKLAAYLCKYLSKGFEALCDARIKRFASSKGIGEPLRIRTRMHALMGEHVYRLRVWAEANGWAVEGIFEGAVAGRRLVWVQCKRVRGRPP